MAWKHFSVTDSDFTKIPWKQFAVAKKNKVYIKENFKLKIEPDHSQTYK